MKKPVLYGGVAAGVVLVGAVVFAALAYRPAIAEMEGASAQASPELIERGRQFAQAGNCASCHTVEGQADFVGGLPVNSNFGIIYSTNITPDRETGIGAWTEEAFARAMRDGVRRDGAHLFPAFPYDHFTKLTDEDISAIYAYLMTLEPAPGVQAENTLPWPLSWRALQGGWKLLFFHDGGAYEPDESQSAEWNRGKYLAEGIGHCSACHSPRNALGAERKGGAAYSGAIVGDWYAPAINGSPDAATPWTDAELFEFLRTGASPLHGVAAGSMSEVVHVGLRALPDEDIRAMSLYFADLAGLEEGAAPAEAPSLLARSGVELGAAEVRGEQIFRSFCVSCHFTAPGAPQANRPALSVNSAVVGPDPTMFVHVVLNGVTIEEGGPEAQMPGFRGVLSDQDVADVAAYLRAAFAGGDPWDDVVAKSQELRQAD